MSRRISFLDHNSSHNSSGQRLVRQIHNHSDTQRSLQEASTALDNAFDHIRHVRRNLLRLTETFPEPLTNGSSNSEHDSVNPGHGALMLSGEDTTDPEQEYDVVNDPTVARDIRGVDGMTRTPPSRSPSPNRPYSRMAPSVIQAPPLPSVLPPRFSRQNIYGLPLVNPESATTAHGLRVAAREAATANSNTTADNFSVFGVIPSDTRSVLLEYERLLAQRRIMPQDPPYLDGLRIRSAMRERPDHGSAVVPPSLPALPPPSAPLNVYRYPFDPFMPTPDPYHRLNYLPLPPVPSPGRPIQRPLSDLPGLPRPRPRPRPTTANRVGPRDESINENMDLTDDQLISWLFPSHEYASLLVPRRDPHNPDTIRITRADEPTPRPDLQPRRRGWARLDSDGNEIPWDEEEELERSRTEYRLRVLQRAQEDSNDPEILRRDGRTFHGSVLDSMLSVPATRPRTDQWRSPTADTQSHPFWVDPLPMPLSSMVLKEEHQNDYHPDVIVPSHACLAGR